VRKNKPILDAARELAALCAEIRAAHPEREWKVVKGVPPPDKPSDPRIPGALRMYRDGAPATQIAAYLGITLGAFYPTIARWRERGWWPAELKRKTGRPRKESE
jgi:Homeodomain-like domain